MVEAKRCLLLLITEAICIAAKCDQEINTDSLGTEDCRLASCLVINILAHVRLSTVSA